MDSPIISVIVPVYNVEQYIVRCLESIINQDINIPIEIIIVDDCGKDNSILIAKEYINTHKKSNMDVIFIDNEVNRGQGAARNSGVKVARGKYIVFVDSDDSLFSNSLNYLYNEIIIHNTDIVEGQTSHIDEQLKETKRTTTHHDHNLNSKEIWEMGSEWMPVCWNKIINKEYFINNNLWFKEGFFYEDLLWAFQVAISSPKIRVVNECTYKYFTRSGSTTHTITEKHVQSFILMISELYNLYLEYRNSNTYHYKPHAIYEGVRSIAIDYVYPKGSEIQCLNLFHHLKSKNVENFLTLCLNKGIPFRILSKVIPMYMGSTGHYIIKFKSLITKLFI